MSEKMHNPNRRDVLKVFLGAAAAAVSATEGHTRPIDANEFSTLSPEVIAQAADMIRRHRTEVMPPQWNALVEHLRSLSHDQKIYSAFSAFRETVRYEVTKTYRTPGEMIASGIGDCKDIAFAQHFLLEQVGVESEVIVALIKKSRALHAYAQARRQDGVYLILDRLRFQNPIERTKAEGEYIDLMHLSRDLENLDDVASLARTATPKTE